MKHLILSIIWFPITFITLLFCLSYYSFNPEVFAQKTNNSQNEIATITQIPYRFYTSLPEVLGAQTVNEFSIQSQDIIPELIYQYLKKHDSPMVNSSQELISAARQFEIDPLFMVAIAQCESNLGKKMPKENEDDIYACHNPFGWGIHKNGTLCFDTWEEGYYTVAEGLREKYYDQGLTNTEDIMAVYTPPALEKDGSWAKCVNKFLQELNEMKDEL